AGPPLLPVLSLVIDDLHWIPPPSLTGQPACTGERPIPQALRQGADPIPQAMYCPPFASRQAPVMKPASSAARKETQRAISSAVPRRPTGICGRILVSRFSLGTACTISVPM